MVRPARPTGDMSKEVWQNREALLPPTPAELKRRERLLEEILSQRALMQPLGTTTLDLIKKARRERDHGGGNH